MRIIVGNNITPVNSKGSIVRYLHDGYVGVLYSPGFGSGWSTWNSEHAQILMFHPMLVEPVHKHKKGEFTQEQMIKEVLFALAMLGLEDICTLGLPDIDIYWIEPGIQFIIEEYDGSESVRFPQHIEWITA